MDDHFLFHTLLPIAGGALILFVLLDVFLTVLYARIGSGLWSYHLSCWLWRFFRFLSRPLTLRRNLVLSFCGPTILVFLVFSWFIGLLIGSAMVLLPQMGQTIQPQRPGAATGFVEAMYLVGTTMTTAGTSSYTPESRPTRMFLVFVSFIGISILTLTVTYLLEIYSALQRRNAFALKLHVLSAKTGDGAELLAGLGPDGRFDPAYTQLVEMGVEMLGQCESHHFYSALFYFRFRESQYSLSRMALLCLDTATLIKSALDDNTHQWLKKSAAVDQLWRGSMATLALLAGAFLPENFPPSQDDPNPQTRQLWENRYRAAVLRLRAAGIKTFPDERLGQEIYRSLRLQWDPYIRAFADHMAHSLENIDPALFQSQQHPPHSFHHQLRAAG